MPAIGRAPMRRGVSLFTVACLLSWLCPTVRARPVHYTMTDLGTLGGTSSAGWAINNAGHVVGGSDISNNAAYHAFISDGFQMQDLGVPAGWVSSHANAVNDLGQAVGIIGNATIYHAAYFPGPGTAPMDLGTLGGTYSVARGINTSGHIVGQADITPNVERAFLYSNGQMTNLGTLPGFPESFATA